MANKKSKGKRKTQPWLLGRFRRRWLWWSGGLALGVAIVVAAIATLQQGGSGGGDGRFRIVAYQGEDVLGGKEIGFADLLHQGKPVVLNFWAGLCPPCRQEMPGFQRVYNEHKDEFILVGVDVGPFVGLGSHDDARRFLKSFNITYPTAYAKRDGLLREYNVQSMPTTVFFSPDGKLFRKFTGFFPEDELRKELKAFLDASATTSARQ